MVNRAVCGRRTDLQGNERAAQNENLTVASLDTFYFGRSISSAVHRHTGRDRALASDTQMRMTKLTPPERRLLDTIERRMRKQGKLRTHDPPELIEQSTTTRGGKYQSRIAASVRRNLASFAHLRRIVVSTNAPPWYRKARAPHVSPKGLQTILTYDKEGYTELWYKTATRGHRAKIFVR